VEFPIKHDDFPVRYVNVYQRYIKKLGLVNGFLAIVLDLLEKNQFRFFGCLWDSKDGWWLCLNTKLGWYEMGNGHKDT
jgi:hypothetical protein